MKRSIISMSVFVSVLLLMTSLAEAVPNLISYQGVLNDAGGSPVNNPSLEMTFSIYDVETGGTALWSEVQNVQVSNGVFNVKLGAVQQLPTSVFVQDDLFLGVQVSADAEMTPRQRITSAAYAHKSEVVEHVIVPIGTVASWMKNYAALYTGSVTGSSNNVLIDANATFETDALGKTCSISYPISDNVPIWLFSDDETKGILIVGGTNELRASSCTGWCQWTFHYVDGTDEFSRVDNVPPDDKWHLYTYTNPQPTKLVWKITRTKGSSCGSNPDWRNRLVEIDPNQSCQSVVTSVDSSTQLSLEDDMALSTYCTYEIFPALPPLPSEWVEMNGQKIIDAESVYNNYTIPDLNSDNPSTLPGVVWILKIK